jgi:hypothetical protein
MTAPRLRFYSLATVVASVAVAFTAPAAQTAPKPSSAPSGTSTATPVAPTTATSANPAPARAPSSPNPTTDIPPESSSAVQPPPVANAATATKTSPQPEAPAAAQTHQGTAPGNPAVPSATVNSTQTPASTPGAGVAAANTTPPDATEPGAPSAAAEFPPAPPPYPQVADTEPAATQNPDVHEPPLPETYRGRKRDEPLPPPMPQHVAPRASLWAGVRPTVVIPLGSMWTDRNWVNRYCCSQNPRPFSEFASAGPGLGVDVGARFGRNYQAFAFGEYAFLAAGPLEDAFGGQESTRTSIFGLGVRFSTHPDSVGFLIEMSLGYRSFEAKWKDGTKLTANDDLFSTRLGVGGIWQINKTTSVDVLFVLGGGAFTDVEWTFASGDDASALQGYDDRGQYIPLGFQVGVHWDLISSKD